MDFEEFYDKVHKYKNDISKIVEDVEKMANELLENVKLTQNQHDFVMDVLLFWKTHLESSISNKQVVSIEKIIKRFNEKEKENA